MSHRLAQAVKSLHRNIDAIIVLEQSDKAETGVVTEAVRDQLEALSMEREEIPIIVDSRDSLRKYPQLSYKMNEAELKSFVNKDKDMDIKTIQLATSELAVQHGKPIFVTLENVVLYHQTDMAKQITYQPYKQVNRLILSVQEIVLQQTLQTPVCCRCHRL